MMMRLPLGLVLLDRLARDALLREGGGQQLRRVRVQLRALEHFGQLVAVGAHEALEVGLRRGLDGREDRGDRGERR
mgnify:CR=1 FL=1